MTFFEESNPFFLTKMLRLKWDCRSYHSGLKMFSFFRLEIDHSVNCKTVNLSEFFRFSALSSCSFFRFICYLFYSVSLLLFFLPAKSYLLSSLFIWFSLILQLHSLHAFRPVTLCHCQSFILESCALRLVGFYDEHRLVYSDHILSVILNFMDTKETLYLRTRTTSTKYVSSKKLYKNRPLCKRIIKILLEEILKLNLLLVYTQKKKKKKAYSKIS